MKINFSKQKYFYLNKSCSKSIAICICGFDSTPAISFEADGSENSFMIHLAFGFGIFITFNRLIPGNWFPSDKDSSEKNHWGERELSLKFHHWSLWWSLWMPNMSWKSTDPKWRSGNIDFVRVLKGKHKCEWEELSKEMRLISFYEGSYWVECIEKLRIDSWKRWFTRKSISWEVRAGNYEGSVWKDKPIPVEGKGENSWDCDEDATYSSTFSGKSKERDIKTPFQAALYFEQSMKKERERRGGNKWTPQAFKTQKIQLAP